MHIIHLVIFYYLNVTVMMEYNSVALILLALSFPLIKKQNLKLYSFFNNFEVLLYAWLCAIFIGVSFGTEYILIVALSFSFISYFNNKLLSFMLAFMQVTSFLLFKIFVHLNILKNVVLIDHQVLIETFGYLTIAISFFLLYKVISNYRSRYKNNLSEFQVLVERDELTKLLSREAFLTKANLELHNFKKYNYDFTVAFCDIDDFKQINDNYGHDIGDLVLKHVAEIFNSKLRTTDYCCRWGGEEFVILLSNTNIDTGRKVISKLRKTIEVQDLKINDQKLKVTVTFGISKASDLSIMEIINLADSRMYKGKKSGKNVVVG